MTTLNELTAELSKLGITDVWPDTDTCLFVRLHNQEFNVYFTELEDGTRANTVSWYDYNCQDFMIPEFTISAHDTMAETALALSLDLFNFVFRNSSPTTKKED